MKKSPSPVMKLGMLLGGGLVLAMISWSTAGLPKESYPGKVETASSLTDSYDVIVVGAGLSGLTTALDLGRAGARVAVVDMASVFGGHAVMANGDLNIADTPLQKSLGVDDSSERAMADILAWGESSEVDWVKYYAENSREDIYDWLSELGVEFTDVLQGPGDSVRRVHLTKGRGIGLVSPVYRECLNHQNIHFFWNSRVTGLQSDGVRVTGVKWVNRRTDLITSMSAPSVVLATGGFQSNLEMVRQYWAAGLPFPEKFLAGSGVHSVGEGHRLAENSGGALVGMERQMNLSSGIIDPRFEGGYRGLNAGNKPSVWVNLNGERFIDEWTKPAEALPVVLQQPGMTFWSIFDQETYDDFRVSGSDWISFSNIDKLILSNRKITRTAETLAELAEQTGLPAEALQVTMDHYNGMVRQGRDRDYSRFPSPTRGIPPTMETPPYYAVQFFPLTRKSMGGVAVDLSCRVRDAHGEVIPGLFAVGELTGSAGINGKSGMSGMFLGPCVLMGRVASRAIIEELGLAGKGGGLVAVESDRLHPRVSNSDSVRCLQCHNLPALIEQPREGFWHFEQVHRKVQRIGVNCAECHGEVGPEFTGVGGHRIDPRRLSQSCVVCHLGEE